MRRPKVISNFAISADGKVSTRNQTPSGFTSERDKRRLLETCSLGDALLVGRGTAEKDNMTMTIPAEDLRLERLTRGQAEHPMRVLISNSGRLDPALKVFTNRAAPTLIYSTKSMSDPLREILEKEATVTLFCEKLVPLELMLNDLHQNHHVRTVVCEGGPTLLKALLAGDFLDEMYLTIAPKIFGGRDAPTMTGLAGDFLPETRHFHLREMFVENDEAYCHYVRKKTRRAAVAK